MKTSPSKNQNMTFIKLTLKSLSLLVSANIDCLSAAGVLKFIVDVNLAWVMEAVLPAGRWDDVLIN